MNELELNAIEWAQKQIDRQNAAAALSKVVWPGLTPALRDVLGMMNFQTCPIAHGYRAAGHDIPNRCEDEQAFVLHRFIGFALEHGDNWRKAAAEDMRETHAKAMAASGKSVEQDAKP